MVRLGKEDQEEPPLISHHFSGICCTGNMAIDIDLDQLTKVIFVGFLCCQVTFFPAFHTILLGKISLWATHTQGVGMDFYLPACACRGGGYVHKLLRILLHCCLMSTCVHSLNRAFCKEGCVDFYAVLWDEIQHCLLWCTHFANSASFSLASVPLGVSFMFSPARPHSNIIFLQKWTP